MKGKVLLVLLSGVLFGCSTTPNEFQYKDEYVAELGRAVAKVTECARRDMISSADAYRYSYSVFKLLSLGKYDQEIYSSNFRHQSDGMYLEPDQEKVAQFCNMIAMQLPQGQEVVNKDYASVTQYQQRSSGSSAAAVFTLLAGALAATGEGIAEGSSQENTYAPIPMPTGEVTFGQDETNNSNYLVNTPNGTVLCNVSSSGFVNCY